jgi:hypothetical protein
VGGDHPVDGRLNVSVRSQTRNAIAGLIVNPGVSTA